MKVGFKKRPWATSPVVKLYNPVNICFHVVPACDGRIDGRTDGLMAPPVPTSRSSIVKSSVTKPKIETSHDNYAVNWLKTALTNDDPFYPSSGDITV